MKTPIKSYKDLRVYNNAMEAAMKIFELNQSDSRTNVVSPKYIKKTEQHIKK
jgi:hypothetical protein